MKQKGFISPLLLALIAVLVIGGGAYAYVQNKQTSKSAPATSTAIMRSSDFEVSLNKKDANRILGSLSGDVSLLIEGTSCCKKGEGDPYSTAEVRDSLLKYVKDSHAFNFSQDQAFVGQIKKENPKFQNYTIGIGYDESVVMYQVNAQNKVNDLYLARTYKLLISDASLIDKTANWKTYTNTKYGFSLKYPDINARLKTVGGWTDSDEPRITSKTLFNYDKCVSAGEGPGMRASNVTIAGREYCLITVFAKEPGPISSTYYEYISRIGNEDIGIVFEVSFATGVDGQKGNMEEEAQLLFNQILSTLKLMN